MKLRIGLVSNSSSSCFICNTTMTEDEVRNRLVEIVEYYNKMMHEEK